MNLENFGIVISDTSRSRAYLQLLFYEKLIPSNFIVLDPDIEDKTNLLGKSKIVKNETYNISFLGYDSKFNFDPNISIFKSMNELNINFKIIKSKNINDNEVINQIKISEQKYFIYSGFGGIILKDEVLGIGKDFLHVHGGYLPTYRGSTCNYYSLIKENIIGASSIIMKIDQGPLLISKKFKAPKCKKKIDHIYDPLVRAKILVDTLKKYLENGSFDPMKNKVDKGVTYYVIHPLLKHFSILK